MQITKEEQLCKKRLIELANNSYYKEYPTYSSFLSLNEQSILPMIAQELPPVNSIMWGGNPVAERKMICFCNEEISKQDFPIAILKVRPQNAKFAQNLTHRDYLGAIMNLGIERSVIGDILLDGTEAYVFVEENMKDYIKNSIEKVKHTNVVCEEMNKGITFEQKYQEVSGTVQSVRLDSVIALAFRNSRSQMLSYISGGKVFVNGRLIEHNSYQIKEGDIISVRGMGKFLYEKEQNMTKKGKIKILLRKYV